MRFSKIGPSRAVLSAYAVPIKLKDECPPPPTFGKDPPPVEDYCLNRVNTADAK